MCIRDSQCVWKPQHFSGKTHRGYCYYDTATNFKICDSCKSYVDFLLKKIHDRDLILFALTSQESEISKLKSRVRKKHRKNRSDIRTRLLDDQDQELTQTNDMPDIIPDIIPEIIPDLFQSFIDDETTSLLPVDVRFKNEIEMTRLK